MAQNGQFEEGREGHHAIGHVNFSKLLVQRYLDSRGEGRLEFRLRQSNLHIHKDVYDFGVRKRGDWLTPGIVFATFWA